jgi:hypothetical protein
MTRRMRRRLFRLLLENNPFYLLSAFSMLVGCYILADALALRPGQTGKLLLLLATLNVYEFLLIVLALFLVRRLGLMRDGLMLLLLGVPFLVDATFLNGEFFAADLRTGALVSAASLILAVVKVLVVVRALRLAFTTGLAFALYQVGVVFVTPGLFALLAGAERLSAAVVYSGWWIAGVLISAQAVLTRSATPGRGTLVPPAWESTLRRAWSIAPHASLALHLAAGGWLYDVPFSLCDLGPILIALGATLVLLDVRRISPAWRLRLPAAGIILSLVYPSELVVVSVGGVVLSPLRVALLAAGLVYLLGHRLHRSPAYAWAAALCMAAAGAGDSPRAMAATVAAGWRTALAWPRRIVPRTAEQWGVAAVASAFVLLGLGALLSLVKGGRVRDLTPLGSPRTQ